MDLEHLGEASFNATADALIQVTDNSCENQTQDPKTNLHRPSDEEHAHYWLTGWLSHSVVNALESGAVYFRLGNYVKDRQSGVKTFEPLSIYVRLGMHLLFYGSQQQKVLQWKQTERLLREQSIKMGRAYDAPASVNHIEPFIKSFQLRDTLHEMIEPDPTKYKTFNEFFAREIRPDARPVDEPGNELVVVSPSDCRLTAYQTITLAQTYWIKGFGFFLSALLNDADLARQFTGGSIIIARLAPQDYHRWHSPISGTVESVRDIPGDYYTVNPQAINEAGTLDVFCENRRSVMVLRRKPTNSPVVIVAVGAMLVGSVKYVPGVDQPGTTVSRGQCLGYFQYGGSTVIVLFPEGELSIDSDLAKNSTDEACETQMKVGWRVGQTPEK